MENTKLDRRGIFISSDPDETRIVRPELADAHRTVELPLRLLFVADLAPHEIVQTWSGSSRVLRVDKVRFGEVMQRLEPRLSFEVPNKISDAPKLLDLELVFPDLQAFHPEQIARQIPGLASLLEIRGLVEQVRTGKLDLPSFKARMQETGVDRNWAEQLFQALSAPAEPAKPARPAPPQPPARKEAGDADPLDRLLGMMGMDDGGAPAPEPKPATSRASSLMDALMGAVTGGSTGPKVQKSAADLLLADLDGVIAEQVQVTLAHPAFRRLEAAWRGLKFLVDRLDFRKGVHLEVLPAKRNELSEALYHQVLLPEHRREADRPPLSAVVLGFSFTNSHDDIDLLQDLADTGASMQVPIIGSVDAAFFGIQEVEGVAKLPPLRQYLAGPEYIAWNKLREHDAARFLALAVPPMVLRYPHGGDHPVRAFAFEEKGVLWGGGAVAVAAAMAASYVRTGWPTHLYGSSDARLEDLPVWKSGSGQIPLAALLSEHRQADLAAAGFVVLGCRPNHDAAYIAHAPTVYRAGDRATAEAEEEARTHASLPCQLFVARSAQFLLAFQEQLTPGAALADVQAELTDRLRALLKLPAQDSSGAVSVEHVPHAEQPGHDVLAIRLQPPEDVLDGHVSLVMGLQVPHAG